MITGPLYDAMKGKTDKTPIELDDIQMKSFLELKRQIAAAPKVHLLDTTKPIYMEVDASLIGTGSVLYQESVINGKIVRQIIRFGSRRFSVTESLNHTSLEREAMAILIGVKQHMSFLEACPEAIIKTDLKSLITLLSCYKNPSSTKFALISHQIYALRVKWKLIHSPGIDIPLADMLSRLHKPYSCHYTDRHLRYPDLKRDNIMMPPEWRNKPDLVLTTADLLEAMRQQIVFIEKSSNNVKEKRLKALINEVSVQFSELTDSKNQLATLLEEDLSRVRDNIQKDKQEKLLKKNRISAITSVDPDLIISPDFIRKYQRNNPQIANIITMLKTLPEEKIPKSILQRYRLLNDSILVTRKNKQLEFSISSNLRIVCDASMTIHILSLLHVMNGHCGMNTLNLAFTDTYKTIEKSTQGFVKLVCTACRSCRYHRQTNKNAVYEGRIPFSKTPNDTWSIDFMVFKQEQTFKGRKITAAFNVVDLYSSLFMSYPVKDQTSSTVIDCFKDIFAKFNVPRRIVSDNATSLCRNKDVIEFLKANNVKEVVTVTAYNSQANKIERFHKTFRDTLKLLQETFRRKTMFDMYHKAVQLMNKRPLSLSLHPHIKDIFNQLNQTPDVVTPFQLHFGIPSCNEIIDSDLKDPKERSKFIKKWQFIISEYDRLLQLDLDKRKIEKPKPRVIKIGDLVVLKNNIAHKESLRFYKNIYEVTKICYHKYHIVPLFFKGRTVETNGNNLKLYESSELLRQLPQKLRNLLGENLSPEELKRQSEENPDFLPDELESFAQPSVISLRNRITPRDKISEPALSLLNTDLLSDSSDSSSSLFTITDNRMDFQSELSSHITRLGTSQLKTTQKGLLEKPYTIPPLDRHITSPLEQEVSHMQIPSNNSTTKTLEHVIPQEKPLNPLSMDPSIPLHPNITLRKKPIISKEPPSLENNIIPSKTRIEDLDLPTDIQTPLVISKNNTTIISQHPDVTLRRRQLRENNVIKDIPVRNTIRPYIDDSLQQNKLNSPILSNPIDTPLALDTKSAAKTHHLPPSLSPPLPISEPASKNVLETPAATRIEPEIIDLLPESDRIIPANPNIDQNMDKIIPAEPLSNRISPENPKIDSPSGKPILIQPQIDSKTKTPLVSPDSIKHRLRSATLKPFKFLKK